MSQTQPRSILSWFVVAGLAWTLGYIYNARHGGEISWLRQMYEEKSAIASQTEAPRRLLIAGGSGAHYTINSDLIAEELGMPVINLGLDGPVGLNAILTTLLEKVRPGDVVLLVPEYQILVDEDGIGDRTGGFVLSLGRPQLGDIPPKKLAQEILLTGVPTLRAVTKSAWDLAEEGRLTGYYDAPLTERGDPTHFKPRESDWWKMKFNQPLSDHAEARIADFEEAVEAKGAHLVLSLPWVYADRTDPETMENVKDAARRLEEIAPIIYNPETFNIQMDSSLFADTHYHLRPEARRVRSRQIVWEIRPILDNLPAPASTASGES